MTAPRRIAIVGGGISGLAVAYELQRLKSEFPGEFVLYEAGRRVGGIVETVRRNGFVIECGPDAWVTEKPWARELAIELGLESEIIPSHDAQRRTLILRGRELIPMPDGMRMMVPTDLDAVASSPLFTEEARNAYRAEPGRAEELKAAAPPSGPQGDETVANFVHRHFGEEVAAKIAGPLLSGVFGGDIERLSVRSVMPAFVKMERDYGSLILALQDRLAIRDGRPDAAIFTTLKSGLGTLTDAIAATLPRDSIRPNSAVSSISREQGQWRIRTAVGRDQSGVNFDDVVLATPAHITRKLLAPLDSRFDQLLDIDASSAIIVAFSFNPAEAAQLNVPQGFGFLVPPIDLAETRPDAEPSLLACTFVNQKFPHRVPAGGKLIRAFYGGAAAPALLTETGKSLAALARRQLEITLGPIPQAAVTLVRRWPKSLPQYEVGHEAHVATIEQLATTFPGLHLAGNTWHGVGLPDLIRDGRATARKILDMR